MNKFSIKSDCNRKSKCIGRFQGQLIIGIHAVSHETAEWRRAGLLERGTEVHGSHMPACLCRNPTSLCLGPRVTAPQSNFSVHFHVTWTPNINLASYANICWRKRSCGFCRRSPLWATRRLFFLLSTVVFRLAMLQSLLYPALAICAPHRTTLDIWE